MLRNYKTKKKNITLYLTEELYLELKRIAKKEKVTVNQVVRSILIKEISRAKWKKKKLQPSL